MPEGIEFLHLYCTKSEYVIKNSGRRSNQRVQLTFSDIVFNIDVYVGDTVDLRDNNARSPYQRYSWISLDENIASVTSRGVLTANSEGTTTVTAMLNNGSKVAFIINVTEYKTPANVHDTIYLSRYGAHDLSALLNNKSAPYIKWAVTPAYLGSVSSRGIIRAGSYTGTVAVTAMFSDGSTEIFTVVIG